MARFLGLFFVWLVFFGYAGTAFGELPEPPPPIRPPQGESPLLQPATGISLSRDERELAMILLDGSFESDAQARLAFEKLINTLRYYSPGRLFDLSQSLKRAAADSGGLIDPNVLGASGAVGSIRERLSAALEQLSTGLLGDLGPQVDRVSRVLMLIRSRPEDVLEAVSPEERVKFVRLFERYFQDQFLRIDDLAGTLIQSGVMKISDRQTELFIKTVFKHYFSRLPIRSKKKMLKELIALPTSATLGDQASIVLHRAGPQFQKFLQIIAREPGMDSEAQRLLTSLEKSIKPAEFEEIHEQLVRQIPDLYPAKFATIDRYALGAGTMSQIHRADAVLESGKTERIVVRLLRPGIEERVQQDYVIFSEIAEVVSRNPEFKGTRYESLGQIVEGLNQAVRDELNVQQTVLQQEAGRQVYARQVAVRIGGRKTQIQVRVPEIFRSETAKKGVLLMEQAEGVSLPEFFRFDPRARAVAAEEIARMWLQESIFGDGFFHGDLHQGNMLAHLNADGSIRITILDFGMAGRLTPEHRAAFLTMESAFKGRDLALLKRTVQSLLEKPVTDQVQSELISAAIVEELRQVTPSVQSLMESLLRVRAPLPSNFIAFSRGMVMVDQMLRWSGSKKALADVASGVALAELSRGIPSRVVRQLLRLHLSNAGLSQPTDRALLRLFWDQVRAACALRLLKP